MRFLEPRIRGNSETLATFEIQFRVLVSFGLFDRCIRLLFCFSRCPSVMTAIVVAPVDHKVLRTIFVLLALVLGHCFDACALRSCPSVLMNSVTLRRNNCDRVRSRSLQIESMLANNSFGNRNAVEEFGGVLRNNFNYTSSCSSSNQDRLFRWVGRCSRRTYLGESSTVKYCPLLS